MINPYWVIQKDCIRGAHDSSIAHFRTALENEKAQYVFLDEKEIFKVEYEPVIYLGYSAEDYRKYHGHTGRLRSEIPYPIWSSEFFEIDVIQKNLQTTFAHNSGELMTGAAINDLTKRHRLAETGEVCLHEIRSQDRRWIIEHELGSSYKSYDDNRSYWVTAPKNFRYRYMCVIVLGEIAAFTRMASFAPDALPRAYLPNDARALVDHVTKFYQPAPIYTVTVVETDQGWEIDDFGIFNHTRDFGYCDFNAIVQSVIDCYANFATYELPKMRPRIEEEKDHTLTNAPSFENDEGDKVTMDPNGGFTIKLGPPTPTPTKETP